MALFGTISACGTSTPPPVNLPVGIACVTLKDMPGPPDLLATARCPLDVRDREPINLRQIFDWGI